MTPAHGEVRRKDGACLCPECTEKRRVSYAARRAARRKIVKTTGLPSTVKHGASAYTNWGCRCDVCKTDMVAEDRKYRARKRANKARLQAI